MSREPLTDADLDTLAKRWRSKDGGDDVRRLIGALRADRAALTEAEKLVQVAHKEYERGWSDGNEAAHTLSDVAEARLAAVIAICDRYDPNQDSNFGVKIRRAATGAPE